MRRHPKAKATLLSIIICLAGLQPNTLQAQAPTSHEINHEWTNFRAAYPYHVQVIAVKERLADGSSLFILSEPPPHVTLDGLKQSAGVELSNLNVLDHRIGYDGFLRDIVFTARPGTGNSLTTFVSRLSIYLYGTSYKATFTSLPIKNQQRGNEQLDLRISTFDLKQWSIDSSEKFEPVLGGRASPVQTLLQDPRPGVYRSGKPGLILWVVPRNARLDQYTQEIRQFTLDSDIVLGAIGGNQATLIVGRERVAALETLPPLRTETILLLAAATSNELAQSYERNHLLSGKTRDGNDWAPIYLSPDLINTEYGSLLNITDQLLKGWSMNGTVRYINFDYPPPNTGWPFPKPLSQLIKGSSVTFNWNTKGVGYTVEDGSYAYFALNRTGSLPMTYIAEESGSSEYDKQGYEYFATLSDPNLVRVVQYAALYQIFRQFDLKADTPGIMGRGARRYRDANAALVQSTKNALIKIRNANEQMLKQTAKEMAADDRAIPDDLMPHVLKPLLIYVGMEQLRAEHPGATEEQLFATVSAAVDQLSAGQLKEMSDELNEKMTKEQQQELRMAFVATMLQASVNSLQEKLNHLPGPLWPDVAEDLARNLINPREEIDTTRLQKVAESEDASGLDHDTMVDFVAVWILNEPSSRIIGTFADIDRAKATYVKYGRSAEQPGFIVTPSIVQSRVDASMAGAVGGHNLDSAITRFRPSTQIRRGSVKITGSKEAPVILFHPGDAKKVQALVETAGKQSTDPNLATNLQQTLKNAPVVGLKREEALALAGRPDRSRGLQHPSLVKLGDDMISAPGWKLDVTSLNSEDRNLIKAMNTSYNPAIVVRKSKGGTYEVLMPNTDATIRVGNVVDLSDALSYTIFRDTDGTRPLHLSTIGFSEDETRALAHTTSLRLEAARDRRNASAFFSKFDEHMPPGKQASPRAFIEGRFDFAHLEISKPVKSQVISTGPRSGQYSVDVVAKIPISHAGNSTPFQVQIAVFFKNVVSNSIVEKIQTLIRQTFSRAAAQKLSNDATMQALETDLRQAGLDAEIRAQGEQFDSFFVRFKQVEHESSNYAYASR